ncbi:MAG: sulfatase-like hydrolase/transferase [Acidobacteria bacterium]|nr:sulfatase-like hydrolase/transferase [Acidobacteriota bacterium]
MQTRRRFLTSAAAAPLAMGQTTRPNFVFVLVDDLRFDELGCTGHPFAQTPHVDRLAREGANFRNAFAVTPLCSPSRATFLTGLYPRAHGIVDNTNRSAASHKLTTWPRLLQDAGYDTAFLGKWHMGNDDSPRPGFTHWVSFPGQGECNDPVINLNGKSARTKGYITDILTGHAVRFLEQKREKPFCLYLAHKAIHPNVQQRDDGSVAGGSLDAAEDFIPAERHRSLYTGARLPRRENYAKPPVNKPALQRKLEGVAPLSAATVTNDATILNRMRMMKAIDDGVGEMRQALERTGQLDNTVFLFTSDHGYFYGEHCLGAERRLAYEETIRIPLIIRYPAVFAAGLEPKEFALSVDIAPTALDLAGVTGPKFHGVSLRRQPKRDAFLIEYYSDSVFQRIDHMGYDAVRTKYWKYIHYRELRGADEIYDMVGDPYELLNLSGAHGAPELRSLLRDLIAQAGSAQR